MLEFRYKIFLSEEHAKLTGDIISVNCDILEVNTKKDFVVLLILPMKIQNKNIHSCHNVQCKHCASVRIACSSTMPV